jgi:hypothetical protein
MRKALKISAESTPDRTSEKSRIFSCFFERRALKKVGKKRVAQKKAK